MADLHPGTDAPAVLGGRYRLDDRVAAGGMAEVWRATDLTLQRPVAIKRLHASTAANPVVAERFRREAITVARLHHPNIVQVLDTITAPGHEAIVMELVDGPSLRQVLDARGSLTPERVRSIAIDVAAALDAAHRAGVVHRDIKPANVLLAADGRALVGDFGIAKLLEADDLTRDDVMVGTAKYLAPEQVDGTLVDGRADLFALGVVMWECLAGRPPFVADTDAATALARLRSPAPSITAVAPATPAALGALVDDLLQVERARRPPTGAAVVARARQALDGSASNGTVTDPTVATTRPSVVVPRDPTPAAPIHATPKPLAGRPITSRPRRWVAPALLCASFLAAAAAVAFALTRPAPPSEPTERLDSPTTVESPTDIAPARISSVAELDPAPGDGRERPDLLPALTDGDDATRWRTEPYRQRNLGGKPGVGLVLRLDHPLLPGQTLVVSSPTVGWSARVYAAASPSGDLAGWGDPVATVSDARGSARVELGEANGRALLVWFTDLGESTVAGEDGAPRFRVEVGEVEVVGP